MTEIYLKETEEVSFSGRYADLMNDVAFQWVFGRESNRDLLVALLNEFIPDRHFTEVTLYRQRQIPFSKELKKSVFDVSCVTDDGTHVDVEVQVRKQDWFADRCLYYSTFGIQRQVSEKSQEYTLKPVYVVSIDAFTRRHGKEWDGSVLSHYSLYESRTGEQMTDSLHFVFVELGHFNKKWEELANDRERLYFCFKHLKEMNQLPEDFENGMLARLAGQSEVANMPENVRTQYFKNMTTEIDRRAQMLCAIREGRAQGLAEGLAEGKAQGLAEGKAEGKAQGLAEGLAEGEAKGRKEGVIETAAKLKAAGIAPDIISQCTGLTVDAIAAL